MRREHACGGSRDSADGRSTGVATSPPSSYSCSSSASAVRSSRPPRSAVPSCPVRAIYRRAVQIGQAGDNPTRSITLPSGATKRAHAGDPVSAARMINAVEDSDQCAWALAFYTGLRLIGCCCPPVLTSNPTQSASFRGSASRLRDVHAGGVLICATRPAVSAASSHASMRAAVLAIAPSKRCPYRSRLTVTDECPMMLVSSLRPIPLAAR